MTCITRHRWALLVTGLLCGSHIPCGASGPPPDVMRLSLAFAKGGDFDRFVSLARKDNKDPEFEYSLFTHLVRDCNVIEGHNTPIMTLVTRDFLSRIEPGLDGRNVPEGYERDTRFLLIKSLNRDVGLDESDYLEMGHIPYLCLIKIPEAIFPPAGVDFFDYLKQKNNVSALVVEIGALVERDSSMVFVKDESGIIWAYRKHR